MTDRKFDLVHTSSRRVALSVVALGAALGVALAAPAPAAADRPDLSHLQNDERNTIKVFRDVSPSVVFVVNRAVQRDWFSGETAEVLQGTGSGFIWDRQGHIVTNYHVVRGSKSISVVIDDKEYEAEVLGEEPRRDIAVLKIKPTRKSRLQPVIPGKYDELTVGQKVLAIGSPFGLQRTLTTGVISALGRQIVGIGRVTIPDMIQTDASINPGNSGGPLLNSAGELIGMNTMIFSKSGTSSGIGFAVPVRFIRRIVPQIIATGKAVTPGMGIQVFADDVAQRLGVRGVIVDRVVAKSSAERAGLRGTRRGRDGQIDLGDVIVGIDGKKIQDYDDLYNALDAYQPGDEVSVRYLRDGAERTSKLRLIAL